MGRRSKFREAALKAVVLGKDQFDCLGKHTRVDDWLSSEEKLKAKTLLEQISQSKPTPKPKPRPTAPIKGATPTPLKDTQWNGDTDPCFIIANGESRRGFDLNQLKHRGYVIGMNVLPIVEDFWPDALISVDIATVKFISEHDVPNKLEMWSYPRGGVKDPRIVRLDKDWGWSSGPTATRIALEKKGFKTLYILGMDFFGKTPEGVIDEKNGRKINNMYKGTARYRNANSDRTYYGNWLNQMCQNCSNHPQVKFYHVVTQGQKSPSRLAERDNWIDITYSQFQDHLRKMAKKEP